MAAAGLKSCGTEDLGVTYAGVTSYPSSVQGVWLRCALCLDGEGSSTPAGGLFEWDWDLHGGGVGFRGRRWLCGRWDWFRGCGLVLPFELIWDGLGGLMHSILIADSMDGGPVICWSVGQWLAVRRAGGRLATIQAWRRAFTVWPPEQGIRLLLHGWWAG